MGNKKTKVPVIMQRENLKCGAASLAMILDYHPKWITLDYVIRGFLILREKICAKCIAMVARTYRLICNVYRIIIEDQKKYIDFPVIISWDFNSFVVLIKFKREKAIIRDPARGCVEVQRENFNNSSTEFVFCFELGRNFRREEKSRSFIDFERQRLGGESKL